ncbi:hypothetical protein GJU40_15585 [Bacillus lacus]|uniref:Uncharacterized protein n=1 Tax=Metabacillus lacus TaxID=1983721 RepID=A0A7X2LZL7_9BACI|nr:hypothetical protein [Metabacillus lacus]MRX73566.1 hypothetical protein [Metabacillus lacus]
MLKEQVYVLGDQLVAVFSVTLEGCTAKMECVLSEQGVEDYVVEYSGTESLYKDVLKLALSHAKTVYSSHAVRA